MVIALEVSVEKLEREIKVRHHYFERFFDIDDAEKDRQSNLEILARIKDNTASPEDIAKAQCIIANPYN